MSPINNAEEFIYQACRKSFLSLWSYANPRGKKNKELCDILVVCEPDIIIFSVKDIQLPNSGNIALDWERWQKRAIDASLHQIYGAERWIANATHVIRKDGTKGLPFPKRSERRIHRISVSLGGHREVPIGSGDLGKGYVHILDEVSFWNVLRELDTITDFVEYLLYKEHELNRIILDGGGEEDFLAYYLFHNRVPPKADLTIIENTLWKGLLSEPQYHAKKQEDKISYVWDNLIEIVCEDALDDGLEFGFVTSLNEAEIALRTMAREGRFSRRFLGQQMLDIINNKGIRSRLVPSPSGIIYIYLSTQDESRNHVKAELVGRCFVGRGLFQTSSIAVGIAIEQSKYRKGFALILTYLSIDNWTPEDQKQLEYLQQNMGFFASPQVRTGRIEEYPPQDND